MAVPLFVLLMKLLRCGRRYRHDDQAVGRTVGCHEGRALGVSIAAKVFSVDTKVGVCQVRTVKHHMRRKRCAFSIRKYGLVREHVDNARVTRDRKSAFCDAVGYKGL